MARSNSANDATICINIRPATAVISMFSVSEQKPPPTLAIRSLMCRKSFIEPGRRPSLQNGIIFRSLNQN